MKPRKRTCKYEVSGDVLVITTKNGIELLADAEDLELLNKYSWCVSKTGYPVANIMNKVTKMHRYILGIKDSSIIVDHKNRNPLDNRKANLRICTITDNARNKSVSKKCKSGHIGIRITKHGRYNVRITANRKEIHIGNFKTLEEAIIARNNAENIYHGEYGSHIGGCC